MNHPPRISLKAARINAGFSQKAAAKALGINAATLQNYENGKTIPAWDKVHAIGTLYQYPIDYIDFGKVSA